ncbi:fungal-specific transcription factor domain-containing protein [Xylogone sp. PMI_703]|nr:fungal-specific transcription factor domain-containing protein [Xylogone sp. PMI_703]
MSDQAAKSSSASPDRTLTEPPLKRRRVAEACQNCRSQKSKCDGKRPICGRCKGYDHVCTWVNGKKSRSQTLNGFNYNSAVVLDGAQSSPAKLGSLQFAIQSYEKLIGNIVADLPESNRVALDVNLSHIRRQLQAHVPGIDIPDRSPSSTTSPTAGPPRFLNGNSTNSQRYLGEASDVRFFHTIKKIFGDRDYSGSPVDSDIQSYDQGVLHLEPQDTHQYRSDLPTKELADAYIDIYFFTIHIAYPFVDKSLFMQRYEKFWSGDAETAESSSWLSLFYTILAIGAYYTSFPRCENTNLRAHLNYFGHAMYLSHSMMTDCTLENIQMLLAQCFFLLAMGQTDRCWNTLGLAIRVAQSIGLHVEDSLKQPLTGLTPREQETERRTWYSMYVLDRLLALQLGRPVAIHEEGYCVNLPSETLETMCLFDGGTERSLLDGKPSPLHYFTSVIKFSQILGQVISNLYRPSQVVDDPDQMLLCTATLDGRLTEWKLELPRHLRFDLGHTFEKSMIFKRQRNMLAIKFHHLRTLMHRPYLCLSWLQKHNPPLMALVERARDQVTALERICVFEAQQTAHLLHNVTDEKSLVHDFPWWQMISCLLCASSVLLVARACMEPDQPDYLIRSQALDEDAETCLTIFDALSVNSDAARRARDMMEGLKRAHIPPIQSRDPTLICNNAADIPLSKGSPNNNSFEQALIYNTRHNGVEWPGELSDPMAWCAQFLDPFVTIPFGVGEVPSYTDGGT